MHRLKREKEQTWMKSLYFYKNTIGQTILINSLSTKKKIIKN